ncbi:MAG: DUF2141 domain-containing protein [Pseudomonadota bacterium]
MKAIAAALCAPVRFVAGILVLAVALAGLVPGTASVAHAQYRETISNDMRQCAPGGGPAVRVTVRGIKSSTGKIRLQSYRATKADWLAKGKWINRIEVRARKGSMTFCVPVPGPGSYAIAARHDANGNNETDISADGGAMSNNPSINIFNLGRPGIDKTRFDISDEVKRMSITMLYFG